MLLQALQVTLFAFSSSSESKFELEVPESDGVNFVSTAPLMRFVNPAPSITGTGTPGWIGSCVPRWTKFLLE